MKKNKFISILLCLIILLFASCTENASGVLTSSIKQETASISSSEDLSSDSTNSKTTSNNISSKTKQEKSGEHPIWQPDETIKYFKRVTNIEIPSSNQVNYYGCTYAVILENSLEMVFDAAFHNNFKEQVVNNLLSEGFEQVEELNNSEDFYYKKVVETCKDEEIVYYQKGQMVNGEMKYIKIAFKTFSETSTYSQMLIDCITVNPFNYYYPINEQISGTFGKPVTNYLQKNAYRR